MSQRWPGGVISKTPPTITPPVDGEGGSAPGVWTLEQTANYVRAGTWPKPTITGYLWSFGRNNFGQLAINAPYSRYSPVQGGSGAVWLSVSGGRYHAQGVRSNNTLWSWGRNSQGQLGLGFSGGNSYSAPQQVGALTTWARVSSGSEFSTAVKTNGTLWTWGNNQQGGLGIGNITTYYSPKQVGALTDWASVSAGKFFCIAIKTNGTLWGWGGNGFGQLGTGNTTNTSSPVQVGGLTDWVQISAGAYFSTGIRSNGTLWAWGRNDKGQLGEFNTTNYSSPKQVGALTNWAKISAGFSSCIAAKTDGTLWSWGYNSSGQLGLGFSGSYAQSPRQVGALTNWALPFASRYSSGAIKTDGTLWTWGAGSSGQLGLGNTTSYSSPKQVGALTTWKKPCTGGNRENFNIVLKGDTA